MTTKEQHSMSVVERTKRSHKKIELTAEVIRGTFHLDQHAASKALGVSPSTLRRRLKENNIVWPKKKRKKSSEYAQKSQDEDESDQKRRRMSVSSELSIQHYDIEEKRLSESNRGGHKLSVVQSESNRGGHHKQSKNQPPPVCTSKDIPFLPHSLQSYVLPTNNKSSMHMNDSPHHARHNYHYVTPNTPVDSMDAHMNSNSHQSYSGQFTHMGSTQSAIPTPPHSTNNQSINIHSPSTVTFPSAPSKSSPSPYTPNSSVNVSTTNSSHQNKYSSAVNSPYQSSNSTTVNGGTTSLTITPYNYFTNCPNCSALQLEVAQLKKENRSLRNLLIKPVEVAPKSQQTTNQVTTKSPTSSVVSTSSGSMTTTSWEQTTNGAIGGGEKTGIDSTTTTGDVVSTVDKSTTLRSAATGIPRLNSLLIESENAQQFKNPSNSSPSSSLKGHFATTDSESNTFDLTPSHSLERRGSCSSIFSRRSSFSSMRRSSLGTIYSRRGSTTSDIQEDEWAKLLLQDNAATMRLDDPQTGEPSQD